MNDLLLEIPTEYDEEILIQPVWYVIDKVVWVQKILISRQYKLFEYFFWSLCNTLYSRGIFLTESLRWPGARICWSDDERCGHRNEKCIRQKITSDQPQFEKKNNRFHLISSRKEIEKLMYNKAVWNWVELDLNNRMPRISGDTIIVLFIPKTQLKQSSLLLSFLKLIFNGIYSFPDFNIGPGFVLTFWHRNSIFC